MSGVLQLHDGVGGVRHYLDGKPVHCGAALELELETGAWLHGRYETSGPIGRKGSRAFLVIARSSLGRNLSVDLVDGCRVRWPGRTIECTCPAEHGWFSENDAPHVEPCVWSHGLVLVL